MIKRLLSLFNRKSVVDWGFSCGRAYLTVCGYVVAMEGDVLRDMDLGVKLLELLKDKYKHKPQMQGLMLESFGTRQSWTEDLIKFVAAEANGGKLP